MISYLELVNSFINNPRDVITNPTIKKSGKWFYVYVEKGRIVVDVAKEHIPKCTMSKSRILWEKEFEDIYALYIQRKQGISVSKQASETTRNQVYWYGIFSDMGL